MCVQSHTTYLYESNMAILQDMQDKSDQRGLILTQMMDQCETKLN